MMMKRLEKSFTTSLKWQKIRIDKTAIDCKYL